MRISYTFKSKLRNRVSVGLAAGLLLGVLPLVTAPSASAATGTTPQTITLTNNSTTFSRTQPLDLTATSDSGLTVSLSTTTPDVCSISALAVTPKINGTCSITATQAGDDTYAEAVPATLDVVIDAVEPAAPADAIAVIGDEQIAIQIQPSPNDGGSPILYYEVTENLGQTTCQADPSVLPLGCTIGSLTNGRRYNFKVRAVNAVGASAVAKPHLAKVVRSTMQGLVSCAVTTTDELFCWGDSPEYAVIKYMPTDLSNVKDVVITGEYHACALMINGTMRCWGNSGWVGDNRPTPLPSDIKLISAGWYHLCTVNNSDVFQCWGHRGDGAADPPTGHVGIRQIVSTDRGSCAVDGSDQAFCWGATAAVPGDLGAVKEIGIDPWTSCAVMQTGALQCWGGDDDGLVSNEPTEHAPYASIAVSNRAACAIAVSGEIDCWGNNAWNRLTVPTTAEPATQISMGWEGVVCVVRVDQQVQCWGDGNGRTQVTTAVEGIPGRVPSKVDVGAYPVRGGIKLKWEPPKDNGGYAIDYFSVHVTPNDGTCSDVVFEEGTPVYSCVVTGLTAGQEYSFSVVAHNALGYSAESDLIAPARLLFQSPTHYDIGLGCAIRFDKTVKCWGGNDNNRATPPTDLTDVKDLTVNIDGACALKEDGTTVCWGYNGDGRITIPDGFPALKTIAGNRYANCGVTLDDEVACFGNQGTPVPVIPAGVTSSRSVSVGDSDVCNVNASGHVDCWGYNQGNIHNVPSDLPEVLSVSVGSAHVCALLVDHTVRCWGDGGVTPTAGLTDVVKLRSGWQGTCAIKSDGTLVCFGADDWTRFSAIPASLGPVSDVTIAQTGVCATMTNNLGSRCWGLVDGYRLPYIPAELNGSTATMATVPTPPTNVTVERLDSSLRVNFGAAESSGGTPVFRYVAKAAGTGKSCSVPADAVELTCVITGLINGKAYPIDAYAMNLVGSSKSATALEVLQISGRRGLAYCALLADRSVKCWAYDSNWAVANPPADLGPVRSLAVTTEFVACAVLMTGRVKCWGDGWGNTSNEGPNWSEVTNAIDISAGTYHFCVLTETHSTYCWGYNGDGRLNVPVDLPLTSKLRLSEGGTCAISMENDITCWGYVGTFPEDLGKVIDLTFNNVHGCVIKLDKTLRCWGEDGYGSVSNAPTHLINLASVQLADWTTCVLDEAGTMTCWGNNSWNMATVPDDLGAVLQMGVGLESQNCVVTTDNQIACLGTVPDGRNAVPTSLIVRPGRPPAAPSGVTVMNAPRGVRVTWQAPTDNGGDPVTSYRATAMPGGKFCETYVSSDSNPLTCTITGLDKSTEYRISVSAANEIGTSALDVAFTEPIDVQAMGNASCALLAAGTVQCWGNQYNEIMNIPAGLSGVVQLGMGYEHACALLENTTITCWGTQNDGRRAVPDGLTGVKEIAIGSYHGCAIKADDTVVCWGYNGDNSGNGGQATVPDGLTNVAHITASERSTCAVTYTGEVSCWGLMHTRPEDLGPVKIAKESAWFGCAILATDYVRCWGEDSWDVIYDMPTDVKAKSLDLEGGLACIVSETDELICVGRWDHDRRNIPESIQFTAKDIDLGWDDICGVTTSNSIHCWGYGGDNRTNVPQALQSRSILTQLAPVRPEITMSSWSADHYTVQWNESIDDGGSAISSYTAVLNPGGYTCQITVPTDEPLECLFTDLDPDLTYTADVFATNEIGDSPVVYFDAISNTQLAFPTTQISATANDQTKVDFVSTTPDICSVGSVSLDSSNVSVATINNLAKGTCSIEASIGGSLVKSQSFKIAKAHRQRGLNVKVLDFSDENINWSESGRSSCFSGTTDAIDLWDIYRPYSDACSNFNYMIHWSGGIQWPGTYDGVTTSTVIFRTYTDDGSKLVINGSDVIVDVNYHGMEGPESSPITLLAGETYPIEMWMFQGGGGAGAVLYWDNGEGNGTNTVVPASAYIFGADLPKADQELSWNAESAALTHLRVGHPFVLGAQSDLPNPQITYSIADGSGCILTGENTDTIVMVNTTDTCEVTAIGEETLDGLASEPITMSIQGVEGGAAYVTETDITGAIIHYQDELLPNGEYSYGVNDRFISGTTSSAAAGTDTVDVYCIAQDPQLSPYLLASDITIEEDGTWSTTIGTFGRTFGATAGCKVAAALHGDHPLDTWETLEIEPAYPINVLTYTDGWGVTGFNVQVWGMGGYTHLGTDYNCAVCSILAANALGSFAQPNQGNPFSWDHSTGQIWSYAATHNPMPNSVDFVNAGMDEGSGDLNYTNMTVDGQIAYTIPMMLDWGVDTGDRISTSVTLGDAGELIVTEESDLYRCENDGANIDDSCGEMINTNVHLARTSTIAHDGVTYAVSDVYSSLDDSDHSVVSGYEFRTHNSDTRTYQVISGLDEVTDAYAALPVGTVYVGNDNNLAMRTKYDSELQHGANPVAGYVAMSPAPTRLVTSNSFSNDNSQVADGFAASYQNMTVTPDVTSEVRIALSEYTTIEQAAVREQYANNFINGEPLLLEQTLTADNVAEVNLSDETGVFAVTSSVGLEAEIIEETSGICTASNPRLNDGVTYFDVTYLAAGICEFTASQLGNESVSAAESISIEFSIIDDTDGGGETNYTTTVTITEEEIIQLPEEQMSAPTFTAGGSVSVQGDGFTPDEIVQLIVASDPILIGHGTADAQGHVLLFGNLPANISAGVHHLAVYAPVSGVGFQQEITVVASPTEEPTNEPNEESNSESSNSSGKTKSSSGSGDSSDIVVTAPEVSESATPSEAPMPLASESVTVAEPESEQAPTEGSGIKYLMLLALLIAFVSAGAWFTRSSPGKKN